MSSEVYPFGGNPETLHRLNTSDAKSWNEWRQLPGTVPNLFCAGLEERNLAGWDLRKADLRHVVLRGADLRKADLRGAKVRGAGLQDADLRGADLRGADFGPAEMDMGDGGVYWNTTSLAGARLTGCNLANAKLHRADLTYSQLVDVDLSHAVLDEAKVYGIASWNVKLDGTRQRDLVITKSGEGRVTVDRLELAQFVHLLIDNSKLRDVLDTLTSKTVLILGRFTEERLAYLNMVREEVRRRGHIPLVFDFAAPSSKDLTGTVETLARLARFIVVDLSEPRSVPHELATVIPFLRTTPVLPLFDTRSATYAMFGDMSSYPWVLATREYRSEADLRSLLSIALKDAEDEAADLWKRH